MLISLCLCIPSLLMHGQERQGWVHRINQRLTARWERADGIDTAYMQRPKQCWTLSTMSGLTASGFGMSQHNGSQGADLRLMTKPHFRQSLALAYRGLSISLPIVNVNRTDDRELSVSMFGNRLGMEATIRYSTSMTGSITQNLSRLWAEIPQGGATDLSCDFDAYYAFSHRRFSFPAAYSQTYIQRRSAGSPFLSVSIRNCYTHIDSLPLLGSGKTQLYTNLFCLGGGYGHSFALRHGWLLHFSALTSIAFASFNRLFVSGERVYINDSFPNIVNTLNLSAVRSTARWFIGLTSRLHNAIYGNSEHIQFTNTRWQGQLTLGIRF
ncbi:MAG: DUF4421 family protein [Bacteroidales bacterium]|nr:DUF4421 family protein [Bacteroidales bacterium]